MKRFAIMLLALTVLFGCMAFAGAEQAEEISEDWSAAPVFVRAYEQATGKIYIEWEGNAPLYQVYLDGSKVADLMVSHHILDMSNGTHSIIIYPILDEASTAGNKIGVNFDVPIKAVSAGVSLDLDLDSLGLGSKAIPGTPSEPLNIDYKANPIIEGVANEFSASFGFDNTVTLSFYDAYNADEYEITIKQGNNSNYVVYHAGEEEDSKLISKNNGTVSVLLDKDFLAAQDCPAPVAGKEYRFSVLMRKYSRDYVSGERIKTMIHASKKSDEFVYTPVELWKTAPVVEYASQTADGEVTLRWNHEDNGIGCEYAVMQINKVLGVMVGEEQLAVTAEHEFVLKDLVNGDYCINIVPILGGEKGSYSADANVEVKNEWVAAPELNCEQVGANQVRLTWKAPANIESYHIVVSTGDNASLLRFVDLDYSKYTEFDVAAAEGDMEYIYTYDKDIDPENGVKMKFEIYGIRHTSAGGEQKSATSVKTIVVK